MVMEADIRVMHLPVNECQGSLVAVKLGEKHGTDSLSDLPEGINFAGTLNSDS